MDHSFDCILACDEQGGIGKNNTLPWSIKEEMRFFQQTTLRSNVIMGRKTFESLPKPLSNRLNIIVSKTQKSNDSSVVWCESFDEALLAASKSCYNQTFVIGGAQLYEAAIPRCRSLIVSYIKGSFGCDVFIKIPVESFQAICEEQSDTKLFKTVYYKRIVREEEQYLQLLKRCLAQPLRSDRTGVGTFSSFGSQLRFSLSESFPLLTTKRVPFKMIFHELMWFLRGQTDVNILREKGINFWDPWADENGIAHKIYGHNWRSFGASESEREKIKDSAAKLAECKPGIFTDGAGICSEDSADKQNRFLGIDQISEAIRLIKEEPHSRRIIVSAWNPAEISEMALPACHTMFQFIVSDYKQEWINDPELNILRLKKSGRLSLHLFQRSADVCLGLPFNIASYALLVYIVAAHCELQPGELLISVSDNHVYSNHFENALIQSERIPRSFPKLKIIKKRDQIFDHEVEDFLLEGYHPHAALKFDMAI